MKLVYRQSTPLPESHGHQPVVTGFIHWAWWILLIPALLLPSLSYAAAGFTSADIISRVNQARSDHELAPLQESDSLAASARAKAYDMFRLEYFEHVSPEGKDPWYWFEKANYVYRYAGENLAIDFSDAAALMSAWMESPTHRANILHPKYTEIGVAVVDGLFADAPTTLVVQHFGTPMTAPANLTEPTMRIRDATIEKTPPRSIAGQPDANSILLPFSVVAHSEVQNLDRRATIQPLTPDVTTELAGTSDLIITSLWGHTVNLLLTIALVLPDIKRLGQSRIVKPLRTLTMRYA